MRHAVAACLLAAVQVAAGCSPGPSTTVAGGDLPSADEARVTAILPSGGAGAWVGTFDGTLTLVGVEAAAVQPPDDPAWGSVRALADDGGALLVAAGTGLFRLGEDGWEAVGPPPGGALATSLAGGAGALWVGRADPATGLGSLARAGGEAWVLHDHTTAIASASMVSAVAVDLDGSVWVATNAAGVVRRSAEGVWTIHDLSTGALRGDRVLAMAADPLGGVWVSTPGGVTRLTARGHEDAPAHVPPGPIAATTEAVWVGNSGGGAFMYERAANTWWAVRGPGSGQAPVTAIVVDSAGAAWVGTAGDGVLRFAAAGTPLPGFTPGRRARHHPRRVGRHRLGGHSRWPRLPAHRFARAGRGRGLPGRAPDRPRRAAAGRTSRSRGGMVPHGQRLPSPR